MLIFLSFLVQLGFCYYANNTWTLMSYQGKLEHEIVDTLAVIEFNGMKVYARCWNGKYIAPALKLYPGDTLSLLFENRLNVSTNVHFHGFQVTPDYHHGDNVFRVIEGYRHYLYDFLIPETHPVGLYWYHSHMYHTTEEQVYSGMSGMILIGDILENFEEIKHIKEVVWILKDLQLVGPDEVGIYHIAPSPLTESSPTNRSVNGLVYPTFEIEQNEMQLWVFANLSPNMYYKLSFGQGDHESHLPLFEIVRDGHIMNKIVKHSTYHLGPGSRVGFLVVGPSPGVYNVSTLPFTTGPGGDDYPFTDLAKVVVTASERPVPVLPTKGFPVLKDYRKEAVTKERIVTFSQADEVFFIDGKEYDKDRIDFTVKLGSLEKWTIVNNADEDHYFHIHQIEFQVVEENGKPVEFVGYQDNAQVTYRQSTVLLLPFDNPVIVGKFVLHCHILGHEDRGMMANIVVEP